MRTVSLAAYLTLIAAVVAGPTGGVGAASQDLASRVGVDAALLTDNEMSDQRGAGLSPALAALLAALPPGNTVAVQIGDNPPITAQGPGPQAVSLSTGNVTANAAAGPTGASASVSMSNPTNSMTVNTSAGFGSAGASIQSGT